MGFSALFILGVLNLLVSIGFIIASLRKNDEVMCYFGIGFFMIGAYLVATTCVPLLDH